jgi:hypothetical protein
VLCVQPSQRRRVRVPGSAHSARVHPPPARCTRTLPAPSLLQKVDFLRNGFVNLAVNVFSLGEPGAPKKT